MTETGMITCNPYDGARLPGAMGFALPNVSVPIRGGQAKNLIISGGFNVYPKEVADVRDAIAGIAEAHFRGRRTAAQDLRRNLRMSFGHLLSPIPPPSENSRIENLCGTARR